MNTPPAVAPHLACVVRAVASAKINLFFEVQQKRPDGFHEIETLMSPVGLCDELTLTSTDDGQITVDCRWNDAHCDFPLPSAEDNLVTKALQALRDEIRCAFGAHVRLIKRIPIAAGLGGGSSDAAAALIAANRAWNLNLPRQRLSDIAARLGSDIPFFLHHGPAICRGRGEIIEPLAPFPAMHVVIVKPKAGLATAEVYRNCRPAKATGSLTLLRQALANGDCRGVAGNLHNGLFAAAVELCPEVRRVLDGLNEAGCPGTLMSGSGSSCVGICRSAAQARRVARTILARNLGKTFICRTLSGVAA